jgi:hypothetical protein
VGEEGREMLNSRGKFCLLSRRQKKSAGRPVIGKKFYFVHIAIPAFLVLILPVYVRKTKRQKGKKEGKKKEKRKRKPQHCVGSLRPVRVS